MLHAAVKEAPRPVQCAASGYTLLNVHLACHLPRCHLLRFSALHYAAWSGHAHIARKLLMSTSASDRLMLQACTDNYDK